jgi:transposase
MLRPQPSGPVPAETARVARAAFPKGDLFRRRGAELGPLFTADSFADLSPTHGQPALAPGRRARVAIRQFAEALSDRQAADAVRRRIDGKDLLRRARTDAGFAASVRSEFRARLIAGSAESHLLDTLLPWCRERKLVKAHGQQRGPEGAPSTHVLAAVRALNRIEVVDETMRHALNSLAIGVPDWRRAVAPTDWLDRSARRASDLRLPAGTDARAALAGTIGADGSALLQAISADATPAGRREVPAVPISRRVGVQPFGAADATLRWRTETEGIPPSSLFISSPSDGDAPYARKDTTPGVGSKIPLTETCADDLPHRITPIETTTGPTADGGATPRLHAARQEKDLRPETHLGATGFLDATLLVESRADYGVDLFGPTRRDDHWQAQAGEGFAAQHVAIDWEKGQAICPAGRPSRSGTPAVANRDNDVIKIKFSSADCGAWEFRTRWIRSTTDYRRRARTIRPQEEYQALRSARQREGTPEFATTDAKRAGSEGTISRGIRTGEMRRTASVGRAKTHLGHLLTGVALNFRRLGEWFMEVPAAKTRCSSFAALMAGAKAA